MECMYMAACLNAGSKCARCYDYALLKTKNQPKTKFVEPPKTFKDKNVDNSWEDLEQSVADAINQVPTIKEARRSRRSGALWFEKGDIVDTILHPECKERKGNELSTGEKSMSVKREWLEKAKEECKYNGKAMCLPFRFKGDDNTYCIFDMKDIAELVTTMKCYMENDERQQLEIEAFKKRLGI